MYEDIFIYLNGNLPKKKYITKLVYLWYLFVVVVFRYFIMTTQFRVWHLWILMLRLAFSLLPNHSHNECKRERKIMQNSTKYRSTFNLYFIHFVYNYYYKLFDFSFLFWLKNKITLRSLLRFISKNFCFNWLCVTPRHKRHIRMLCKDWQNVWETKNILPYDVIGFRSKQYEYTQT